MASDAQRRHLVDLARWCITHERAFHYLQRRPMHYVTWRESQLRAWIARGGTVSMDCSEWVKTIFHMAGLSDPTGRGFDPWGNTSSMWSHLPHYFDPAAAFPGALVVWGAGGNHHVDMVLERGHDPLLVGHGREAGPRTVRFSHQRASQGRPFTFLKISRL